MNHLHFSKRNSSTQNTIAYYISILGTNFFFTIFTLIFSLALIKISPASIETLSSNQTSVTLSFNLEQLSISEQKVDGKSYKLISYKDCQYTNEPSKPKIPLSRVILAAPVSSEPTVRLVDSSMTIQKSRFPVSPVPEIGYHSPEPGIPPVTKFVYNEDGSVYQSKEFYPSEPVRIGNDGFIRDQRVIIIELHPIQYSPRLREIKLYSNLTIRVDFNSPYSSPPIMTDYSTTIESPGFENFYRANIINYEQAKNWRSVSQPQAAPSRFIEDSINNTSEATYKIYVEKTGIYRLTYEELRKNWNIELSGYDPRYFRLLNRGKEVRIFVKGESDGSFDRGDYIDFLGLKSDSKYTRWNIYWLVCDENKRGIRVAETEGQPSEPTAEIISSFRTKLYFEKDLLHNVLPHVSPEQVSGGDAQAWFDVVDTWFWVGVKNSSEKTEVAINFKLYDLAKSFEQPEINVLLQGGTPAEHHGLVSINDIKVASAKWYSQDKLLVSKSLHSSDSLVDATLGDNILRLSKVDADVNKDAMKYPYHMYINRFDIEYNRLFYAVNDQLNFKTPESNEDYSVRKKRKLEYTVNHFINPEIEIFEYENDMLVSRIRNIEIEQIELTSEASERLIEMFRSNKRASEDDNFVQETVNPKFTNLIDIPDYVYNATFQYPDSHDANFFAVSREALLKPTIVEKNKLNGLRNRTNQADYIIITHPNFLDAANRLADWRRSEKGGGHSTKVVDVTDIYDEFNYGMVNPQAIKDFLSFAYFNWQKPKVANVVIFGDGTYDFLGVDKEIYDEAPELTGFIPPHYMYTAYGQTANDHWFTTVSGVDALADFFIGRIAVEKIEEANAVVDKLIHYESKPVNGPWRRRIISVADDEATNAGDDVFKKSLEEISQNNTLLGYSTTKIFLEDIINKLEEDPDAFDEHIPGQVAKNMIIEELSKGALLIQYSGHGSPNVWAHEIIFDNYAIKKLDNTDKLPFVIVLSCYNGYFDRPGEPSMAETFLRLPNAGSIGMFSATRLTFGTGNEALNKILFDEIFRRDMRTLGEICFSAKVETMVKEGISQLEMMQDYTLFGDPATQLLLADYEFQPELEEYTVGPVQNIKLKEGLVYKTVYNKPKQIKEYVPISNFSGKLTVTVKFPGYNEMIDEGTLIEKIVEVVNGKYPALTISVPSNIKSGRGVVEYYAESNTEIAVGGVSFSVKVPKIIDVKTEVISDNSFIVSALISDELGKTGIEQVGLEWFDPNSRDWETIQMKPKNNLSEHAVWYSHNPPINLPENGRAIKYIIEIIDKDGNEINSEIMRFQPIEVPDFEVVNETESFEPLIYFEIDHQNKKYLLKAEIENIEDNEVIEPVDVSFYKGNPDIDEDYLIDQDANLIGKTTILPEEWQRRNPIDKYRTSITREPPRAFELAPLNINWIAVASISGESTSQFLENGIHRIFVSIDSDKNVLETDEENNISERNIEINSQFIGKEELQVSSNDGVINVSIPANVLNREQNVTLSAISSDFIEPFNQPDIELIEFPVGITGREIPEIKSKRAYELKTESEPEIKNLQSEITIDLQFDLSKFRESIKRKIGLGGIPDEEISNEQEQQVKLAMNDEAKNISMFIWDGSNEPNNQVGKWVKLDSEILLQQDGTISEQLSPVIHKNPPIEMNPLPLEIDFENSNVLYGKWVVHLNSPNKYDLYFAEDGQLETVGTDLTFSNYNPSGFRLIPASGIPNFKFGDIIKFETVQSFESVSVINFRADNYGNGGFRYINVEDETNIADNWLVLFSDESHFWLEGEKNGIVEQNGKRLVGEIGEEFSVPAKGISFIIDAGNDTFEAGDYFNFETEPVGTIRAKTALLGKFTLAISDDTIPPDIKFTIAGQNFINGEAVSSNPEIQATISDDNGIDLLTREFEFSIKKSTQTLGSNTNFVLIPQDEYQLSTSPGANQIVLNYNPELSSGRYELALKAYDLSGNESEETIEFRVNTTTQLLNPMNYPNPFRTKKGTTITCEVTNQVSETIVKIYTLSGRLIRELEEEENRTIGFLEFHWDGRDYDGRDVANGVYYAKIILKQEKNKDIIDYVKIMKLR